VNFMRCPRTWHYSVILIVLGALCMWVCRGAGDGNAPEPESDSASEESCLLWPIGEEGLRDRHSTGEGVNRPIVATRVAQPPTNRDERIVSVIEWFEGIRDDDTARMRSIASPTVREKAEDFGGWARYREFWYRAWGNDVEAIVRSVGEGFWYRGDSLMGRVVIMLEGRRIGAIEIRRIDQVWMIDE